MSYNVFPQLSGITWNIKKRPTWNTTKMLTAAGNEFRTGYRQNPLTEFDLSYSYLSPTDKLSMEGFFNGQNGALTPFYFDLGVATNTPSDNSVTAFTFGIGDGTTTAFTLIKPAGTGAVEPVGGVNGSPLIYKNDWQGNQLQYATPRTNVLEYSETPGSWGVSSVTATAKTSIVPGGTAQLFAQGASPPPNAQCHPPNYTATFNGSATFTLIVEQATSSNVFFEFYDNTASVGIGGANFNFSTNTITPEFAGGIVTATSMGMGPNGGALWRLTVTTTSPFVSGHLISFIVFPAGDPAAASVGTIIHAAQVEAGITSTSIIATTTAPVTVTDYTLAGNQVAFAVAPLLNAILTWTGNFYYLVRFSEDVLEFNQLMNQMYELQECKLVSVR